MRSCLENFDSIATVTVLARKLRKSKKIRTYSILSKRQYRNTTLRRFIAFNFPRKYNNILFAEELLLMLLLQDEYAEFILYTNISVLLQPSNIDQLYFVRKYWLPGLTRVRIHTAQRIN